MSIVPPGSDINPSASEYRDAARELLIIATHSYDESERTFAYFVRSGLSYGLTLSEITEITHRDCSEILRLTDPAGV